MMLRSHHLRFSPSNMPAIGNAYAWPSETLAQLEIHHHGDHSTRSPKLFKTTSGEKKRYKTCARGFKESSLKLFSKGFQKAPQKPPGDPLSKTKQTVSAPALMLTIDSSERNSIAGLLASAAETVGATRTTLAVTQTKKPWITGDSTESLSEASKPYRLNEWLDETTWLSVNTFLLIKRTHGGLPSKIWPPWASPQALTLAQ